MVIVESKCVLHRVLALNAFAFDAYREEST